MPYRSRLEGDAKTLYRFRDSLRREARRRTQSRGRSTERGTVSEGRGIAFGPEFIGASISSGGDVDKRRKISNPRWSRRALPLKSNGSFTGPSKVGQRH
ncbi:hypothetical protein KM043_003957 [Ampulex compressa]|nr:hypothetical protein KM043_003957 [Ampulex compressa]